MMNNIEDAADVMIKIEKLINAVVNEMRITTGLIGGESALRNLLWRLISEHTKLLREYYKIGE